MNFLSWATGELQPWKWEASFLNVRNVKHVYILRFGWDKNPSITFCFLFHIALLSLAPDRITYPPLNMINNMHWMYFPGHILSFLSGFFLVYRLGMAHPWSHNIIFSIEWKFFFLKIIDYIQNWRERFKKTRKSNGGLGW